MATSEQVPRHATSARPELASGSTVPVVELAIGLYDHYQSVAEVKAYYGVLAIYALARTAVETASDPLLAKVETVLRRFPDQIDHPHYNFLSYRIGGIAQSYLIEQGRMLDRRALLQEYAEEMMAAPRDGRGILTMPHSAGDLIWIDVAMAATPFLMFAGQAFGRDDYVEEAVNQAVLMYDEFLDPATGLLHQCKNFIAPGVRSSDHWSRGNGWGFFALAELVAGLPTDHPRKAEVEQRYLALATSLLAYQGPHGLWRQEIPMAEAWEESSGTALILYGLGLGLRANTLAGPRWAEAVTSGLQGLTRYCINPDYSTENSCPGTLCPGSGAEKGTPSAYVRLRTPHRDEPHSFGTFMLALSIADTVGLAELPLRSRHQTTPYLTEVSA